MALNLSGVFEIGTSLQSAAGNAEMRAQKNPLLGAFASGVLATVVATPCMAPGLGASVGFTLGQSAPIAMLVFLAIAVGLALPIVLLSFFPAMLRFLPKPGAWMETFKQFMAFPLYATVVWLIWVLGAQTGNDGVMKLLVGLTVLALAAWVYGRWQVDKPLVAAVVGIALAAAGITAAWAGAKTEATVETTSTSKAEDWIAFSPDKITELRGQGKAVFIDFTATWCITCQVNKRSTLNQDEVVKKMAAANVVRMKADWTKKDEIITKALAEFGRNGVPLYVLYPAKGQPEVLPELLTPSIVIAAVDRTGAVAVR
jgi:thiol:disulfide interchange protein